VIAEGEPGEGHGDTDANGDEGHGGHAVGEQAGGGRRRDEHGDRHQQADGAEADHDRHGQEDQQDDGQSAGPHAHLAGVERIVRGHAEVGEQGDQSSHRTDGHGRKGDDLGARGRRDLAEEEVAEVDADPVVPGDEEHPESEHPRFDDADDGVAAETSVRAEERDGRSSDQAGDERAEDDAGAEEVGTGHAGQGGVAHGVAEIRQAAQDDPHSDGR
jgi:hypothetical protein